MGNAGAVYALARQEEGGEKGAGAMSGAEGNTSHCARGDQGFRTAGPQAGETQEYAGGGDSAPRGVAEQVEGRGAYRRLRQHWRDLFPLDRRKERGVPAPVVVAPR